MGTFELRRGRRWLARAVGRNPLLRRSDRIEAWVLLVGIIIALAGAPAAAWAGTAVHTARDRLYAEQAQGRQTVAATVVESDAKTREPHVFTGAVRASWRHAGHDRTGWVLTRPTVKVGDTIAIWVDDGDNPVMSPTPRSQAIVDAVGAGVGLWLSVAVGAGALVAITRSRLNHVRLARWGRELETLTGGGRSNLP